MTPGTNPSPGENREGLDQRADETRSHGEQVRWTRNFCEDLKRKPGDFKTLIDEFHKGTKTKDQLRAKFKEKLKGTTQAERAKMGLASAGSDLTDTEIDAFLTSTNCFDNQLMAQIENDINAKNKAREDMVANCVEVTRDEYGDFNEEELKDSLKKEEMGRLRTFLEVPKYRNTYLKKLPGSQALKEKSFSDINFDEITRAISKIETTHPKRRAIQEAWLKISQVAHPDKNLAGAFSAITREWGPKVDVAGAYGAFFGNENTLISAENREKILNFLTRQYVPVVPFKILEVIDPKTSKAYLTSEAERKEFEKNLPPDPELAEALKKDKEEQWKKTYQSHIGGGKEFLGTRNLPFETKVRILSQFGSIGKAEQMLDYYRGNPASLRKTTDNEGEFRERFKTTYPGIDPEKLDTKSGFLEELTARLGHRIEGLEHFGPGCVMQWKTKNHETKEDMTGYYIIDTIPSEDIEEDNILTVRFLGNDQDPLSPSGLVRHYTGADFYHYLDGCADDGRITFRDNGEFEKEMEANTTEKKLPRYYTEQETQAELRNRFPDTTEVMKLESLDYEVNQILNPRNDHPKEAKSPDDRKLHDGMIFTKVNNDGRIDTFQIRHIDEDAGTITLWDGWGSSKKSEKTMSFTEFSNILKFLKESAKADDSWHRLLYRLPVSGKRPFGIKEFNQLCSLESLYDEWTFKKMKQVNIREGDGNVFGKIDKTTGTFHPMPIVKIGEKKDLYIESIDGTTVTYRRGTFKQGKYDEKKQKAIEPGFSGSPPMTMSLAMLWAYLNENQFDFEKPESAKKKPPKEDGKLGWWNILMHSHSWGVILQGDLWKAPFKAWEEQHHKDHDFAGKMTAALAMEKIQSGGYGPLSGIWNWAEWPSLMVADGNSSFQSYLNELVEKIDNMGSYHRTKLIKKWATKEHFPSVKFMAAMMASMQIFGQLYPYDEGEKDPRAGEWFWYRQITHSLDPDHKKYPHMPLHEGDSWPEFLLDPGKNKMNEIQACHKLFNSFQHPMLKNLGRRFQKYMMAGQEKLQSGGKWNLNERTTMEGKLDWMMGTVVSQKIPEAFGEATELWLKEWYPANISTMPYAATLFGCREQQMLPATQEAIKKEFQDKGVQIPMFVFMQNKDLGDVFRETSIAFAHTISPNCGKELESIVKEASENRIHGGNKDSWTKKFSSFWKEYGKELMHKLSGMRDPMLNLMINDPQTFEEMIDEQTEPKKSHYKRLYEKKNVIRAYYDRLRETYDSPTHCKLHRDDGYYSGDHFRFRDSFDVGYPIAWVNWDHYLDANLDEWYAAGSKATSGDGVFNELRAFLYEIPNLAKKMAEDMWFTGEKKEKYIHKISKGLFEKNSGAMKRLMEQKIDATVPKAEYCSMTAMMLGIMDVRKLSLGGADAKLHPKFDDYFNKMLLVRKKADKIAETDFAASIVYRAKMATKWSQIVRGQIDTKESSIEDIYEAQSVHDLGDENKIAKLQKDTQALSGTILAEKLNTFDKMARKNEEPGATNTPPRGDTNDE